MPDVSALVSDEMRPRWCKPQPVAFREVSAIVSCAHTGNAYKGVPGR